MRTVMGAVVLLLILVPSSFPQTSPAGTRADTVLINGKILTVDDRFSIQEAIAIKEGKIVAVGKTADIQKATDSNTRVIDLQGRTVIPGLIDSHLHGIRAALSFSTEVNWIGASSRWFMTGCAPLNSASLLNFLRSPGRSFPWIGTNSRFVPWSRGRFERPAVSLCRVRQVFVPCGRPARLSFLDGEIRTSLHRNRCRVNSVRRMLVEPVCIDRPLSVDEMARKAFMSPRTFARRFREETGTTPHQWLTHQRLLHAQRLLETTNDSMDEIAETVGFGTATTLRQHFARFRMTSPTAYRRRFSLNS